MRDRWFAVNEFCIQNENTIKNSPLRDAARNKYNDLFINQRNRVIMTMYPRYLLMISYFIGYSHATFRNTKFQSRYTEWRQL